MSDPKIESICGAPIDDTEPPSWFKVGTAWQQHVGFEEMPAGLGKKFIYKEHVVTAIDHRLENRGDHGVGWYDVKAGDVIIASFNERHVHEVYYEIPISEAG